MNLQQHIEELYARETRDFGEEYFRAFDELKAALNAGTVRAAEPDPAMPTGWKVNTWVKKGILLGFRIGRIVEMRPGAATSGGDSGTVQLLPERREKRFGFSFSFKKESQAEFGILPSGESLPGAMGVEFQFRDKHTYPLKQIPPNRNIRIVPGGSSVRDGCYIGQGVVCMPPMYVNVGAYVDDGTMVDSHALVGSCAQIGKRVHLSAAAQIGGVLEPVGALPVIIEDDVLVGGNCGVYEGTVVKEGAVLAAGVILTGSTPVYDLVRESVYRRKDETPLIIPAGAVVVPGARAVTHGRGKDWGLSLYTPIIIKYRDEKTDAATRLEELLR